MKKVVTRGRVPLEKLEASFDSSLLLAIAFVAILAVVVTVESCRVDRRDGASAAGAALRGNIRDGVYSDHVDAGGM